MRCTEAAMGRLFSAEDLAELKKEASYRIVTLDENSKAQLRRFKNEKNEKNEKAAMNSEEHEKVSQNWHDKIEKVPNRRYNENLNFNESNQSVMLTRPELDNS